MDNSRIDTSLKLDIAGLSPVDFTSPHSLHRLPTPGPSRGQNSSLGSDIPVVSPDNHKPDRTRLAPPHPLPSPNLPYRGPSPPPVSPIQAGIAQSSPSDGGWSPQSNASKTSAFFGSSLSSATPAPAPPTPLIKSKSISRLSRDTDSGSTFAFNNGQGGANVNRSVSDSHQHGPPRRAQTVNNASFFSQSSATLTPDPPPSLSRRPSAKNRARTPERGDRPATQTSPDRARLLPRERFFPSRANVDKRTQWEEAGYMYGSPPSGFGSTTSLNGFGASNSFVDWGGSQASWGGSTGGGSSRGVSPTRPDPADALRRAFVELHDESEKAGIEGLPKLTTSFSDHNHTPRPINASLPTPISLTPTKKPVRSAHAKSSALAPRHHHLEREKPASGPRSLDLKAGSVVSDADVKLRLIRPLGVGAFSCVWLAEDEQGSLAAGGDRRGHSTSEAKRRRDRRMHGLRPSANGSTGDKANDKGEERKGSLLGEDLARGRDPSRQHSPLLIEVSPDPPPSVDAPGRLVAVKMMDRALCDVNDRTRISFVREVEVLRHISHPSIVAYLHSFTTLTHHCLVVEHIGGGELFELINLDTNRNRMTEPLLRRLWGELCRAVGWMHSVALVHRDIKLENILVTSNPFETPVPPLATPLLKLTDFGLSRFIDPNHPELTTRCGSEEYAAPEIIMGSPYDGRETDAWACGVVLFALGTRTLPFADQSATSPAPSVRSSPPQRRSYLLRIAQCQYDPSELSEGARRIVGRLLVRTPSKRAKISELWSDPWMRGAGAPPPPPGLEKDEAYLVDQEGIDSVARQEIPISSENGLYA